jgi:photosystem II stability/assembly factor-like uncharacterized protein
VFVLSYYPDNGVRQTAIFSTSDAGLSWRRGPSLPMEAYGLYLVDPQHGWALNLKGGTVLATSDGGQHWSVVGLLPSEMGPVDLQFITTKTGWLMGMESLGRTIFKTEDGGVTWTSQLSPS